jgi:hypothetical protein
MAAPQYDTHIATASIEEGLDFACSLASDAISKAGEENPTQAQRLLHELTNYVHFRYVDPFCTSFDRVFLMRHFGQALYDLPVMKPSGV